MHFHAWRQGLKTGQYYFRSRPARDAIKFTVDVESLLAATASGAILGALQDRGLQLDACSPLTILASSPTQLILEAPSLRESTELQPASILQQWIESSPGATPAEAGAWAQAFANAQHATRTERMRIRARLHSQVSHRG